MRVVTALEEERHLTQIKNFPQLSDHRKETSLSKSTSRFNANYSHNGWTAINGTFSVLHTSLILFSIGEKPFSTDRFFMKLTTKRRSFFILNMLHYSVTCAVTDWSKQHNFRKNAVFELFYCIFDFWIIVIFSVTLFQYITLTNSIVTRAIKWVEIEWHWK